MGHGTKDHARPHLLFVLLLFDTSLVLSGKGPIENLLCSRMILWHTQAIFIHKSELQFDMFCWQAGTIREDRFLIPCNSAREMHACGHDCHTAILMAVAEVLAEVRAELRGSVKLIFQPAEEGLPNFEVGGARRMLDEGAFQNPRPEVVFGLHVVPNCSVGTIFGGLSIPELRTVKRHWHEFTRRTGSDNTHERDQPGVGQPSRQAPTHPRTAAGTKKRGRVRRSGRAPRRKL